MAQRRTPVCCTDALAKVRTFGVRYEDSIGDLDRIDEALMTYVLSDEALEAAARVDGARAMTVGYCATAANAWYCLPF